MFFQSIYALIHISEALLHASLRSIEAIIHVLLKGVYAQLKSLEVRNNQVLKNTAKIRNNAHKP